MTADELAAALDVVASMAPRLREAGVQSVACDGVVVNLAPPEAKVPEGDRKPPPDQPHLSWNDVPGFGPPTDDD